MKNIKQYTVILALALCAGMNAMEKEQKYDLTIPLHVGTWAKSQGISMTYKECCAFAGQQLAEREFVLYSTASTDQKKNWDKYDLTHASGVASWAAEFKNIVLSTEEATAFAKVWKKQSLVHKIEILEHKMALDKAREESIRDFMRNTPSGNNNNAPQEKNDDLTDIDTVIRLARAQGIIMTRKEANAYVNEILDQQEIANVIANLDTNNAAETKQQETSDEVSDNECFLCMEDVTPADRVAVSKNCKHTTHKACLAEIKKKHANCPVCQAIIE